MVYIMNIMITRFHRAAAYKLTRRLHIQVGYLFFLSFFFFFFLSVVALLLWFLLFVCCCFVVGFGDRCFCLFDVVLRVWGGGCEGGGGWGGALVPSYRKRLMNTYI